MVVKPQRRKVQREYIIREEKEEILKKSKGCCAHCGKKIEIGKNFTVEHVIPLSRGGNNDLNNLVGLCKDCNSSKGNFLVCSAKSISKYYRNLTSFALRSLLSYCKKYLDEYQYLDWDNWYLEDKIELVPRDIIGNVASPLYIHGKVILDKKLMAFVNSRFYLKKVQYSDLDSVLQIYIDNCSYLSSEEAKRRIGTNFLSGTYYMISSATGKLVCCFFVEYSKQFVRVEGTQDEASLLLPRFKDILITSLWGANLFSLAVYKIFKCVTGSLNIPYCVVEMYADRKLPFYKELYRINKHCSSKESSINDDVVAFQVYILSKKIKIRDGNDCAEYIMERLNGFFSIMWDNRADYLNWLKGRTNYLIDKRFYKYHSEI